MKNNFLRFEDADAQYRLILLHGWGADAEDLIPLGKELINSVGTKIELIALRAPELHPDGIGRQWYGLFPAEWASVPAVIKFLQAQIKSLATSEIPLEKTFVLGFSQGAAMAIGSCCDLPIAGIISSSGYPHPKWKAPKRRPLVLLTHGIEDEVVPVNASKQLYEEFTIDNEPVELFLFNGGHEISKEAINKIMSTLSDWIDLNNLE